MAVRAPMGPALLLDYKLPDVFPPVFAGKVLIVMATIRKDWKAAFPQMRKKFLTKFILKELK